MSTHPVAVKRRHDRQRNARILIGILVAALVVASIVAVANLHPGNSNNPSTVAASKAPELTFTSPGKGVTCQLTSEVARCMAPKAKFPPPIACPGTMEVRVDTPAPVGAFACNDGPIEAKKPLAFGDQVTRGAFMCRSFPAAMRCINTETQHGFSISAESFIVF